MKELLNKIKIVDKILDTKCERKLVLKLYLCDYLLMLILYYEISIETIFCHSRSVIKIELRICQ